MLLCHLRSSHLLFDLFVFSLTCLHARAVVRVHFLSLPAQGQGEMQVAAEAVSAVEVRANSLKTAP